MKLRVEKEEMEKRLEDQLLSAENLMKEKGKNFFFLHDARWIIRYSFRLSWMTHFRGSFT